MLIFNLKKEWFEKIKSGEKTHEYREVKPYWTKRIYNSLLDISERGKVLFDRDNTPLYCKFINGYSAKKENILNAEIIRISKINGIHTDLAIDRNVYDIEFELLGEQWQE